MLSTRETRQGTRSRKRQKLSHNSDTTGEPSTKATQSPAKKASSTQATDMEAVSESVRNTEKEFGAFEEDLETMRQLITCKVCQRFLTEPYGLACGHTYCYICLDTWLVGQRKNTCPECRATVKQQPIPSLIIREMVELFSTKHRLLPEGETFETLEKNAVEAAQKVTDDKADTARGGLFKGMFGRNSTSVREPMYDAEDNVHRCPLCFHEVEDGSCTGCGELVGGAEPWSDGEMDDFDDDGYSDDDDMLVIARQELAAAQRVDREMSRYARREARERQMAHERRIREPRGASTDERLMSSDSDADSSSSENLEGFVVDDNHVDLQIANGDNDSASTVRRSTTRARRRANASRPVVLSDSDSNSHNGSEDEDIESHIRLVDENENENESESESGSESGSDGDGDGDSSIHSETPPPADLSRFYNIPFLRGGFTVPATSINSTSVSTDDSSGEDDEDDEDDDDSSEGEDDDDDEEEEEAPISRGSRRHVSSIRAPATRNRPIVLDDDDSDVVTVRAGRTRQTVDESAEFDSEEQSQEHEYDFDPFGNYGRFHVDGGRNF